MAICSDRHIFVILIHTSYPTSLSTRHAFQSHNKTNYFFRLKTIVIIVIQIIKTEFYNDKLDYYAYINFTQLELSLVDLASPFLLSYNKEKQNHLACFSNNKTSPRILQAASSNLKFNNS